VPDKVLAQLGNRVQHALRAFTPRDQKAVKSAADTLRPNPALDAAKVITELGKGEALVSFLEGNGIPAMVDRCMIRPPSARVGPITPAERQALIAKSPLKGKYEGTVDSESAYEVLQKRVQQTGSTAPPPAGGSAQESGGGGLFATIRNWLSGIFGTNARGKRLSTGQVIARNVTRSVTTKVAGQIAKEVEKSLGSKTAGSIGRAIVRGTMGGILRR
jgi:DNA double-strand break repair helicase HerA and related ATPase